MSEADILAIFQDGLWTTLVAVAPAMAASLVVGLAVALFPAGHLLRGFEEAPDRVAGEGYRRDPKTGKKPR